MEALYSDYEASCDLVTQLQSDVAAWQDRLFSSQSEFDSEIAATKEAISVLEANSKSKELSLSSTMKDQENLLNVHKQLVYP
jgi:hypothetical protein